MMIFQRNRAVAVLALIGGLAVLGPVVPSNAAEQAVKAEVNPPGDIPDNQVFITYAAPLGATLQVPEGWGRNDTAAGAVFSDKYNILEVRVAPAAAAPTVDSVNASDVAALKATDRAANITSVKALKLDGGDAIRIDYAINSDPNPVTNKQIRLEGVRFILFGHGKIATLDMRAPYGADNVDQWRLMSNSLRVQ
ncbi:MAG: hypothetical protein J0I99_04965 [Devosia sp.]|uniref:hypothetical protein n=1 Tax=Devosia sp. TaxID=1871048 RepID=UPI001AC47586|nr:hypothetical protein [Devosia sp.]MBN9315067.1 hypothetical protein [Devosia sp.]